MPKNITLVVIYLLTDEGFMKHLIFPSSWITVFILKTAQTMNKQKRMQLLRPKCQLDNIRHKTNNKHN
ncbi:hypothetical protein CTT30_12250 [Vibrio coralliilyticus]|nr:hypothetical protein CTT30_12250 [Vibrio coralliilyticus]